MAIWEIETPEGAIYEIEGDEEPTEEQIDELIKSLKETPELPKREEVEPWDPWSGRVFAGAEDRLVEPPAKEIEAIGADTEPTSPKTFAEFLEESPLTIQTPQEWGQEVGLKEFAARQVADRLSGVPEDVLEKQRKAFLGPTPLQMITDPAIELLQGAIGLPEAAVGLVDIIPGVSGAVGKALELGGYGFQPAKAKEILHGLKSEEAQAQAAELEKAEGVGETVKLLLSNPELLRSMSLESLPLMLGPGRVGAGIVSRALPAIGARTAALIGGGLGEGAVSAGLAAEQFRQESETGELTGKQVLLSHATGATTTLIGIFGGKLARRLGIDDIDTLLAGGKSTAETQQNAARIFLRVIGSAVEEGAFEELPQSIAEQIFSNLATGQPWDKDVLKQGIAGGMVGSLMGMAGGAYGVARGEGGGMTPEEFVKKINKRDLAGGNLHLSIPGGMVVDSISDLNAYAKAHDRAVKDAEEARKKFREAKTEDELREHGSAAMEHLTAAQLVKEAIQYAVNLGGWSTEKTKNKNLPKERPLNWKENPHVAKWLVENAERFGFDKLEDMQDVRDFLLAPREASFPGLTPGPTQGPVPITEPPVESVKKPAEEKLKFPGLVAPKKATITEPETATQRPSHRGVSLSPSEFVQKLDALDVAGGNNALSIPAGMSAASIADLEEYAKARERAIQRNKEVLEKYSQAKTEEEKSKFDKLLGQPQIASQMAREAILYAVDWGTWSRAESPPDLQAERPLDWKKNPDVAKWLLDNAERIGIDKEPYMPQLRAAVEAQSKKKAKPEGAAPEQIPAPAKGAQFTNVSTPGADSRAISGHYAVVEASDAITSTQPGYDMRLQGRDRSSRASAEQIQEIVSQLKPWELGESHTSDQGAPFLNPNNNVLSGNGRIMALRKHYDAGGTQYKDWLVKNAAKFGLNPDEVAKMQRPILVRYATDYGGLSEPDFAARSNARVGAAFTEAEFARSDAMLLENNPDMLRLFNPSEEGDIIAASNHSFLTAFVNSVIDGQSLRTREGFNSAALSRRVKNAMLALVLGTERQNLISTLVESSGDMGMSNLVNGVMRAASKLIQLRGTAYDISIPLGQALDDFVRIKRSGQKLVDFLGQRSLFGDDGRTAMSDAILISLTKMKSIKSAFEALSKYADEAKKQIEMAQVGGGLFGEQPLSAQQIWGNLSENEPTATQQTLPPAKPQGPSGEPPEPAGTTPVPEPPDKGPAPATGGGEPEKPVQPAPTGETKPVAETPPEGGTPPSGPPIIDKDAADKIRERLRERLRKKGQGTEEVSLESVSEASGIELEALSNLTAEMDVEEGDVATQQELEDAILEALSSELEMPKPDAAIFSDAVLIGSYYYQSGLVNFDEWSAKMVEDFGEEIKPYLQSVYETAKQTIETPGGLGGDISAPGGDGGLPPAKDRIVSARGIQTPRADESILPKGVVAHLNEHQRQGAASNIHSMIKRGGALNADGTGVGKTREALAVAQYWAEQGFKVIYITKNEAIKPNRKKGTFGGSLYHDSKAMGIPVRLAMNAQVKPGEIGVTTYENTSAVKRVADAQTVLIWDESHALKNNSQRGRAGDAANRRAKAVLFLSATPADKPQHIYYLERIGIMEGKSSAEQLRHLGMTLVDVQYRDKDTQQIRTQKVWMPDQTVSDAERARRFTELFDRMTESGAMIKREISLKGVDVGIVNVNLPPEGHALQDEIVKFFGAKNGDIRTLRGPLKAICLGNMRRQQEPFKVAPTVLLTQRELAQGRQVMIFVSRVNESVVGRNVTVMTPFGPQKVRDVLMSSEGTVKLLRNALKEAGIEDIVELHGEADEDALVALKKFNDGKARVCIATIESGGTGINADDTVGNRPRTIVVVTAPFGATDAVQASGRIWRLTTKSKARIYFLMANTQVDQWNASVLASKFRILGAVVSGQVKKLDISNPDLVTPDDFGGEGGPTPPTAPVGEGDMPKLEWQPYTTRAGKQIFAAPATKEFWTWYKSAGNKQAIKDARMWVGKGADDTWKVFSMTDPTAQKPAAPEAGPAQGEASLESAVKPEDIAPNPAVGNGEVEQFYMGLKKETGIPDGVKDPGIEFAPELMEASRRLGTLVRTYSALKPGVLGRYLPGRASIALADKIEVGDIENLATAAHEMGHDIDALLFPTIWSRPQHRWHTQESLAERIGLPDSRKGQLMSELIQVSVIMRGVIPPSGAYNKYRRRATELIADWFSMYAFDPELAKNLAPLWTEGFERALAGNPDVQETVQQLHAGNVIPIPGSRSPGAATGSTPADMPGAMPPREVPTPTREVRAAVAAEELVKGVVRLYEAMVQKARIRSDRWRKLVPIQQDRNDVGAFVEGIGNLEIPGDTLDKVQRRMTPEKQKLAKQYRLEIEKQRGEINQLLVSFGDDAEYLAFLMDYLPHFYINAKTPLGVEAMSKFMKQSKNAKQRKLPSLQEAVKLGLIPVSQDPAVLAEIHARINWRVATNRVFLQSLKNIKTSAGEDVVVPASKNPGGWPVSNNPLIQRVYAKMGRGAIMLWRGGAAIHPDVWHAVRQILETPTRTRLGRIYDAINSFTRANAFAFSFFHDITLAMASAGSHGTLLRPLRGLVRIFERDPATGELRIFQTARSAGKGLMMVEDAVFDAAKHGLKFSWTDSESYQVVSIGALEELAARLRHIPVLGKTTRFASDLQNWRQRKLWRDTHDALKLLAYHDMVSKALSEAPAGTVSSDVKEMIASLLNDAFGGQEWQTKFWLSPQARMVAARFWLAPDWTLSTLRSVPFVSDTFSVTGEALQRALGKQPPLHRLKEGWKGNMGRLKFWRAELTVMALATIAAQYAIYLAFGDDDKDDKPWPWENEEGQNRRIDVTPLMRQMPWWDEKNPSRYYVNMGKRPEEVLHWVTKFDQNIQSKLARPINEAIRQIVGMEGDFPLAWKREHMTFVESIPSRAKSVASLMVPYTFSGNQFALSLPYRKGMSKYKAQHAFESAYEVIGTPNRFGAFAKSLARGHFTKDMEQVLVDIADAASRNGVQVDMVRRQALSEVRSRHYTALFREYQNGDLKAMEREAEALFRLGATIEQINASIKRREKSLSR